MENTVNKLRHQLSQYRYARINEEVSIHINAIDIAISLVEYSIKEKRAIYPQEEGWFNAGLLLAYVLQNSEWEDLYDNYRKMCIEVKRQNFFR